MHHIPPPFNALLLLNAFLDSADSDQLLNVPAPRCTVQRSAADIAKKSKHAQLELLKSLQHEDDATSEAQLRAMHRSQRECADKLERIAASIASQAASPPASSAAAASQAMWSPRLTPTPRASPPPLLPRSSRSTVYAVTPQMTIKLPSTASR